MPGGSQTRDAEVRLGAPFAWFLASAGSWFGSWGMQQVIFAWLVVEVLREDPTRVGTAQMVGSLPGLLLLLGGALADRLERRTTLALTHLGASLAALVLLFVLANDGLSFGLVLFYAATWGTLHALHLPARDALLFDVGSRALGRAVPATTVVQFGGQAAGNLLVGTATWLGGPAVLAFQSALTLAGIGPALRLPTVGPRPDAARKHPLHEIREGIGEVLASSRLRSLTLLISYNGIFFIGPYFVLVPILLRDEYAGGVDELAVAMMMFPLGTISVSWLLLQVGDRFHRGRAHFAGQLLGGLCVLGIAAVPPYPVLLLLAFVWGVGGGAFLNMGRSLFLEAAPESHRGRCLSVYTLALMGVAPIGLQTAGLVGEWVGAATACLMAGVGMLVLLAVSWVALPVRHFE